MLEEKILMWKFKHGSAEAFERIYARYKNDLLKLAVVLAADVHTAEDIVHDVFVHAAQNRGKIRANGNLKGLLAAGVVSRLRNCRRDRRRQQARAESKAEGGVASPARPEQWAILSEQLQLLRGAMAQLPYDQREVIMLHFQAVMTFKAIAKSLGVSVNTTKSRYRYGMDKLRLIFENEAKE